MKLLRPTRLIVLACLAGVFSLASATIPGRIDVDRIYDVAEHALVVRIISGRMNSEKESDCGVRYRGRVEISWKGMAPGSEVEFDNTAGPRSIGSSYLVYLTSQANRKGDVWVSTNTLDMERDRQLTIKCQEVAAPYRIAQWGAIFLVTGDSTLDMKKREVLMEKRWAGHFPTDPRVKDTRQHLYIPLDAFDTYYARHKARAK